MRYLFIFWLCLSFSPAFSQNEGVSDSAQNEKQEYPDSLYYINNQKPLKYKVLRIKKNESSYAIDLLDVGSRRHSYTILSLRGGPLLMNVKEEEERYIASYSYLKAPNEDSKKIKRGKEYEFILYSYYPTNIIGGYHYTLYFTIQGVRFPFKGDRKYIVTTPNLRGLYYIPPE